MLNPKSNRWLKTIEKMKKSREYWDWLKKEMKQEENFIVGNRIGKYWKAKLTQEEDSLKTN